MDLNKLVQWNACLVSSSWVETGLPTKVLIGMLLLLLRIYFSCGKLSGKAAIDPEWRVSGFRLAGTLSTYRLNSLGVIINRYPIFC